MKLLDLRAALPHQPGRTSELWRHLFTQLEESLTRLRTLRELVQWEESPATPAALEYRQSITEEADLLLRVLDEQTTTALAAYQARP